MEFVYPNSLTRKEVYCRQQLVLKFISMPHTTNQYGN